MNGPDEFEESDSLVESLLSEGFEADGFDTDEGDPDNPYENFTKLASHVIDAPVSLVTIIDYENARQVFKAQTGLSEPWASKMETPLTHSFCQHVANNDHALCIEDATQDPLLKTNLAIPDLGVIAYLGTPIRNKNGEAIGAFCVISGEVRRWTDNEKETVSHISKCVSELLIAKEELVGLG